MPERIINILSFTIWNDLCNVLIPSTALDEVDGLGEVLGEVLGEDPGPVPVPSLRGAAFWASSLNVVVTVQPGFVDVENSCIIEVLVGNRLHHHSYICTDSGGIGARQSVEINFGRVSLVTSADKSGASHGVHVVAICVCKNLGDGRRKLEVGVSRGSGGSTNVTVISNDYSCSNVNNCK